MRLRLPERGERGAIAIMTAFLMVVLLAVAALAVDITTQVNVRQKLYDTVDAAAQAGAYRLPSPGATAASDARANALKNDPTLSLPTSPVNAVTLFCVVASKLVGGIYIVDNSQIPATCYPLSARGGSPPNYTWSGSRCNSKICGIPCNGASDVCNTIKVTGEKTVPFAFAPAIGITAPGRTGSVSSVACKGVCGTIPINPMDVVVVADRTSSMESADINAMITGIKGMFQEMTPSQQYVALGTIGRSKLSPTSTTCSGSTLKARSEPWNDAYPLQKGPWIPEPFSNNYLNTDTTDINTLSTLVNGVECLKNKSSTGTWLASPLKAAARYLLGPSSPYDSTTSYPAGAPARTGTIRKAIIFETDGAPNESTVAGSTALNISGDIGSSTGATACNNFTAVANNAKNNVTPGILVVTVAYNIHTSDLCGGSGTPRLDKTLAAAASPAPSGVASLADQNCADGAVGGGRDKENGDGDYFFCAASGTDMKEIYKTAFGQIANGIRLIQLP